MRYQSIREAQSFRIAKRNWADQQKQKNRGGVRSLATAVRGGNFMKLIVTGRNMGVNETHRDYLEEKIEKYSKYFRSDLEVHATFSHRHSKNKNFQIVEITIPLKLGGIIRVQEEDLTIETAIDLAVEKLNKQIGKHKTKLEKRYRENDSIRFEQIPEQEEAEEKLEVVKTKRFAIKPMDPEEAVLQMEMMGHNFYVFRNQDSDEINVVYARKDGKYGLIEPTV
jgi:putative sigma-54 modulation protein